MRSTNDDIIDEAKTRGCILTTVVAGRSDRNERVLTDIFALLGILALSDLNNTVHCLTDNT